MERYVIAHQLRGHVVDQLHNCLGQHYQNRYFSGFLWIFGVVEDAKGRCKLLAWRAPWYGIVPRLWRSGHLRHPLMAVHVQICVLMPSTGPVSVLQLCRTRPIYVMSYLRMFRILNHFQKPHNMKTPQCENPKMWKSQNVKTPECENPKMWKAQNVENPKMWKAQNVKSPICEKPKCEPQNVKTPKWNQWRWREMRWHVMRLIRFDDMRRDVMRCDLMICYVVWWDSMSGNWMRCDTMYLWE